MNYVDVNILVHVCDAHEYIFLLRTGREVKLMSHRESINTDLLHTNQSISNVRSHQQ